MIYMTRAIWGTCYDRRIFNPRIKKKQTLKIVLSVLLFYFFILFFFFFFFSFRGSRG